MIVFRVEVAPRIIAGLETIMERAPGHVLGGPMHVDGAYSTIRAQNHDLKTYSASPPLGYQRSSRSDISPATLSQRVKRAVTRLSRPISDAEDHYKQLRDWYC